MDRKSMIGIVVLFAAAAVVAGVVRFTASVDEVESVVLEPKVVRLVEDPLENERVFVQLQLRNSSSRPVTVTEAAGSCGCMSIMSRGGQPFFTSLELAPNSVMPWLVEIDTKGRFGQEKQMVLIRTEVGGRTAEHISTIRLNIRSSLRAAPSEVLFSDAQVGVTQEAVVELLDGYPDPGIVLQDPVSPSSDLVLRLTRVSSDAPVTRNASSNSGRDVVIKTRYLLHVAYTPNEAQDISSFTIELRPKDTKYPSIEIPVVAHWAKPDYALCPDEIVLVSGSNQVHFTRRVLCRIKDGSATNDFVVLSSPSFVKVHLIPREDGDVIVDIQGVMPEGIDSDEATIVLGASGSHVEVAKLPIRVIDF